MYIYIYICICIYTNPQKNRKVFPRWYRWCFHSLFQLFQLFYLFWACSWLQNYVYIYIHTHVGFLKWGYPQIIHFHQIVHCKPSTWRPVYAMSKLRQEASDLWGRKLPREFSVTRPPKETPPKRNGWFLMVNVGENLKIKWMRMDENWGVPQETKETPQFLCRNPTSEKSDTSPIPWI